ncbi:MAG: prepilin-type N-terminal cleavage/methylation domain-containing protein [Bacillota bacterium]|nr:prepilin-type N-terminal cleavage/methylation domain-containing protein [Bacillota bacterium]
MSRGEEGFTLLEVLAAVIISTLVITVVIRFHNQTINIYQATRSATDISENILITFNLLEAEIKTSEQILTPLPGASGNKLILKQGPYPWDNLQFYYKNPQELWRLKNNGDNPVAYGINQVNFKRSEAGQTIEISIKTISQEGTETNYLGAATIRR